MFYLDAVWNIKVSAPNNPIGNQYCHMLSKQQNEHYTAQAWTLIMDGRGNYVPLGDIDTPF